MPESLIGKRIGRKNEHGDQEIYVVVADDGDWVTLRMTSMAGYTTLAVDRRIRRANLTESVGAA